MRQMSSPSLMSYSAPSSSSKLSGKARRTTTSLRETSATFSTCRRTRISCESLAKTIERLGSCERSGSVSMCSETISILGPEAV